MQNAKKLAVALLVLAAFNGHAEGNWTGDQAGNPMDGDMQKYVISKPITPMKELKFPYGNMHGAFAVVCEVEDDGVSHKMFLAFTIDPNMPGGDIEESYTLHKIRVKFDNLPAYTTTVFATHAEPKRLGFVDPFVTSAALLTSTKSMMVEIPIYSHGKAYFKFDLTGYKDKFQSHCGTTTTEEN